MVKHLNPDWLEGPLRGLLQTLNDAGFEAFAVGGCVRDALLERPCNDIDVTTNATPDQVNHFLGGAGWKMYPTGIDHGTWTVGKGNATFEVTTYRRDVATDGRRATIEFADTMEQDAERRDFTMNALYMDSHGVVYDPTNTGIRDAQLGWVRFVGDANTRCEEDYLRILRMYRFYATHGRDMIDLAAQQAATKHVAGLDFVSRERILAEIQKLLACPNNRLQSTLQTMTLSGVTERILPMDNEIVSAEVLMHNESLFGIEPNWRVRYVALFGSKIDLPMAKKDRVYIETLTDLYQYNPYGWVAIAWQHGVEVAVALALLQGVNVPVNQLEPYMKSALPVTAQDFKYNGFEDGPELGQAMRVAMDFWLMSGLTLSKDRCISDTLHFITNG